MVVPFWLWLLACGCLGAPSLARYLGAPSLARHLGAPTASRAWVERVGGLAG
ncbi:hypothetical protein I6A84_00330 [Frankia sp. CNm7]|uniref:Uncharacterized protein n=1 Tax=Frankia nepalensis TaxID=1836974 RepID=A0A937ULB6_9ACTN|nr:hypothetical protein [Frankia nepalensis]MBL7501897.1 hypothetical protein [Frankia nepalensis]MBL7513902.1 hypothetical protein [Frankia nepalensis]MBL7516610.1 hypothetical protein [Frankia nepalensis]MBL7625622.1 hypothetical protein [Frankia nepalensis]